MHDVVTSTYRLLLVEDSADDAELLLYSLREAPFEFTAARVDTEAEYLAELGADTPPDVVLCDYHLPRFSAEGALQILQTLQLDIPFIVVSHHIGEDAAVTAMQNGASDYLLKSRLGRLAKAIESAIDRRISRQQKTIAEKALLTSEAMKRGILNSLSTRIAVLDGKGVIVATNKSWENFDDLRGRMSSTPAVCGLNYLDLLREAALKGVPFAERSADAIESVIRRETKMASLEYEVSRPGGTRWFLARAMPLEDSTDGAVISHEDITDRMLAHHALGEANKRLQAMSKRVLSIQEDERRRISRELHDDIGQSLTALKIGLHRIAQRTNGEHKELLTECLSIADTTLDKLRHLSTELRPPQLDQLGLTGALEWLVDQQRKTTGLDVECQFAGLSGRLPVELESACYRITQEALNNATRHAAAKHIQIRVEVREGQLMLVIRDDGAGFDLDAARNKALKSGSLGLISMEERAQLAGGRLTLRAFPGMGTTVQVIFALDALGTIAPDSSNVRNLNGSLWP
ncbi:MAG: histidine kinase [Usitatibacteraceae bacterium]